MELEVEGTLAFMDIRFIKMENGKLRSEVYRKLAPTNRYVQSESNSQNVSEIWCCYRFSGPCNKG